MAGSNAYNGIAARYSYSGENASNCSHPSSGSPDGSHTDASLSWYWVLYAHNQQLHALAGEWTHYSIGTDSVGPPGISNETIGTDREFNGRRYYRLNIPAFVYSPNDGPRGFTGTVRAMCVLHQLGSLRREYDFFQELKGDQITWFDEAMTNTNVIGTKAKLLGVPAFVIIGSKN